VSFILSNAFLEPTTGLDPLSKRKVWEVIQSYKKERIIVLTSHSMEEADYLADSVIIMHTGRIKAQGTPLFLKNRYGDGYQVNILDKESGNGELMEKWVNQVLPGCSVLANSAGSLTLNIGKSSGGHLSAFLRLLQQSKGVQWGLSHTTLESVFLKLCASNDSINEIKSAAMCRLCGTKEAESVTLFTASRVKVIVAGITVLF
jgi:ABC-type multidrug transport system ATPase subunit